MMKKNVERLGRILLVLVGLLGIVVNVHGNVGAYNDSPYKTFNKDHYTYIYSTDWENYLDWVIDFNERLRQHYQDTFGYRLDEKTALSLTSNHNQVANAYATMMPYSQTVFFFGAAESIDEFSVRSWVADLLIHESSHLYQLNAKHGLSKIGHAIFGNTIPGNLPVPIATSPLFILPLPFLTHPNVLLPTWLLEGNGVFNESRFGNGGRLFSGASRALFYSLLKAGLLDETRLTNNGLYFPFTTEKYIIGGYFNLYLAERFGTQTLNRMFWAHAIHYFNPLRLNSTFKNHFGVSYSDLIGDFINSHKQTAAHHAVESGEILFTSMRATPLNRIGDSIVFLSAGDGRDDAELVVLNTEGKIVRSQKTGLPPGKIFWHDHKLKSAATGRVQRKYIHASLFTEHGQDTPEFDSKLVQDMDRKNGTLYYKMTEGFHAPVLYHDETKIAEAHSSAILSHDGEAIYFRQFKDERTCFKGKRPLFSLPGFYGAPMDVGPEGEIYFTGATAYGSGLFVWRSGRIFRLGFSDAVYSAKKLQNERYLLVEFTPQGYEYKLATLSRKEETPVKYQYFFENEAGRNLFDGLLNDNVREQSSAPSYSVASSEVSNYSMLGNLRFSSWVLRHQMGDKNGNFQADFYFVDPMGYNQFVLNYENDTEKIEQIINTDYRVTRWLLNFGFALEYQQLEKSRELPTTLRDNTLLVELPISYNFLDWQRWKMDIEFRPGYWQTLKNKLGRDYPSLYESLIAYKRDRAFLGFYPMRAFSAELENSQDFLSRGTENTLAFTTKGTYHLGAQFYIMAELSMAQTDSPYLEIGHELRDERPLVPAKSVRGIKDPGENVLYGLRSGAMLKTVIDSNWQGRVFPLGLRRWSPGIFGNYFSTNTISATAPEQHFFQTGVTLEAELLLAHSFPVPIEISYIEQVSAMQDRPRNSELQVNLKSSF
ncbi:MAG: hypothetical protein HYV97_09010 [Bdellovibrio sp.]|nr:hypothetical protein [Bdellovibrio sp.]